MSLGKAADGDRPEIKKAKSFGAASSPRRGPSGNLGDPRAVSVRGGSCRSGGRHASLCPLADHHHACHVTATTTQGGHHAQVESGGFDPAPDAQGRRRRHLRRLRGRRREGARPGDQDRHPGDRGRRRRGRDRRLPDAGVRGAPRERHQCPDRHRDLGDLGRARVGEGRDPALRQGRLLRGGSRAVQAGRRRGPHPERPGHPEDRARGAAQAAARRRRGRGRTGPRSAPARARTAWA